MFLKEARAILERTDEALRNVCTFDERRKIDLHVGYSSWGIDRLFHIILNAHNCAMPNVHVRLHDGRVEDNVDALLAGKLELAFIFVCAKTRRAPRPSFPGSEPGAHPSRRLTEAPILAPARCFSRGRRAPTVHRFGAGGFP